MAFAWPLAWSDLGSRARSHRTRRPWLRAALPAALICAGALVLSPPWRAAASKAVAPAPAAAPAAPGSPALPAAGDPATLLGALLVVAGALALLPALLSKLQSRARGGGRIELVEVRPLGGRRSLMLVQVGARRLLVGSSENGLATLAELDAEKSFAEVAREAVAGEGARG